MKISEKELQGLIPNIRGLVDPKVETRINEAFRRVYEYMLLKLEEQGKGYQDQIKSLQDASAGVNQQLNTLVGAYSQPLIGGTPDPLLQNFSSQFGPQDPKHFLGGPVPKFREITTADILTAAAGLPAPAQSPASKLDADGTILDVNVIVDGEILKRVGSTVVSIPASSIGSINPTDKILPVRKNGAFVDSHFTEDTALVTSALPIPFSAFWKLDDTKESFNKYDLTNTGGVTFVAGKIGNCALLPTGAANLSCAMDNAIQFVAGQPWCISFWFKRLSTANVGTQIIYAVDSTTTGFSFIIQSSQVVQFYQLHNNDWDLFQQQSCNDTNWHHMIAWHDPATNTSSFRMDNGGLVSLGARPIFTMVGGGLNFGAGFIGSLDAIGMGHFVPTVAQQNALWNAGTGYEPIAANVNVKGNQVTINADQVLVNGKDVTIASRLDSDGVTLDVNVINDGQYLKRVGATVVGANVDTKFPYSAMVGMSVAFAPSINGWRDIFWDTNFYDFWTMHNQNILIAQTAGNYLMRCHLYVPPTGPSGANFGVGKNGAIGSVFSQNGIVNTGGYTEIQAGALVNMAAGDYVFATIYLTTGGSIVVGATHPFFSLSRVG